MYFEIYTTFILHWQFHAYAQLILIILCDSHLSSTIASPLLPYESLSYNQDFSLCFVTHWV